MSDFLYYLTTFVEAVASVFGLRFAYEQPHYTVIQNLGPDVEVRQYDPRLAIEATVAGSDRDKATSEAFTLLFRYITGANQRDEKIAMTAPVRTDTQRIAMTAPVQTEVKPDQVSMRFFLPVAVAKAGAPEPTDPHLHLIEVPAATIAAIRFSGSVTQDKRDHQAAVLYGVLAKSQWRPDGAIFQFSYDPPFTIPFLRRNEVAVAVQR
ncbi:MAG TPA: heme-binding protein [Acetobacteraceae bacterium]|jgi:hypothetical protein|nr:heme-binding protein [Acetobacteraceae bacterium]